MSDQWSRSLRHWVVVGLLALLTTACGQSTPATSPTAPAAPEAAAATTAPEAPAPTSAPAPTAVPAPAPTEPAPASALTGDLIIYSGRSEPLMAPIIELFKQQNPNVNVQLKAAANNELAAALLEERANPQADLFITTDILTVANLGNEGVFEAYQPQGADQIPAEYRAPDNTWTSFTARARVIIYNAELLKPEEVPTSVFELTDPKWKGQIAAAGSTNGAMQAHIAAIRKLLGEQAAEEWVTGLLANDVTFFGGHTDVRKAVGAGEFKIGLVNHYYYHLQRAEPSDNNVGVIYPDQGADQMGIVVNTTAGGVVKGGPNPENARAFVDFLLTREVQYQFAELNYEYPLVAGIEPAADVKPVSEFKLAQVSMRDLYDELDETQALIQKVSLP
jgi:iron(III) transport system substrate-binding protein